MHENSDFLRLVVNSIRKDLDENNEINNCLALHAIANVGGSEMAEALAEDVHRLLISPWVIFQRNRMIYTDYLCQYLPNVCQEESRPHFTKIIPKTPGCHPGCWVGFTNSVYNGRSGLSKAQSLYLKAFPIITFSGCRCMCYKSGNGIGPRSPRRICRVLHQSSWPATQSKCEQSLCLWLCWSFLACDRARIFCTICLL